MNEVNPISTALARMQEVTDSLVAEAERNGMPRTSAAAMKLKMATMNLIATMLEEAMAQRAGPALPDADVPAD